MRNSFLILCLILLGTPLAYAFSCAPIKIQIENNNLILPGSPQAGASQLFFFKNNSPQSLFIDRANKNSSTNVGWSTYLRPGNWAALALHQKNITISCVMVQPGKVIPLNCSRTLFVCASPQPMISPPSKRTTWLIEDKSWEELAKKIVKFYARCSNGRS
ncbi:MAG: hypothetical protein K0S27_822 [Gammaproteobacteria bacterium]|nr:hypothetical protein [Gammaproteobacteria bacterium]